MRERIVELKFDTINRQLERGSELTDHDREQLVDQVLTSLRHQQVPASRYRDCALVLLQVGTVRDKGLALALAVMADSRGQSDRFLIAQLVDNILLGRRIPRQHFGTQFDAQSIEPSLYAVDPATTNAERARFDVPELA
jgi:hypothetical protein